MGWTEEWVEAGRAAEKRAAERSCDACGAPLVVGYSNLGIPFSCCPACSPSLVENGARPVGEAWGFREPA